MGGGAGVRRSGGQRRPALLDLLLGEVAPLVGFFGVALHGRPRRGGVAGEGLEGGLDRGQAGLQLLDGVRQSRERRRRGLLEVAKCLDPAGLFFHPGVGRLAGGDDVRVHLLFGRLVLGNCVVELLANGERRLQLRERVGDGVGEGFRVHVVELGLGETQLLLSVADRVVRVDEQLVGLPCQLTRAAVALLRRKAAAPPGREPQADQHEPGTDDEDGDQRPQNRACGGVAAAGARARALVARSRDDRGGRRECGGFRNRVPGRLDRGAKGLREADDAARVVAGSEACLEVRGQEAVDRAAGEAGRLPDVARADGFVPTVALVVHRYEQQEIVAAEAVRLERLLGQLRGGRAAARRDELEPELDVVLAQQVVEGALDPAHARGQDACLVRYLRLERHRALAEDGRMDHEQEGHREGEWPEVSKDSGSGLHVHILAAGSRGSGAMLERVGGPDSWNRVTPNGPRRGSPGSVGAPDRPRSRTPSQSGESVTRTSPMSSWPASIATCP